MNRLQHPQNIHAWIIGADISSLAAAVYLICDAKIPGHNIHVLDMNTKSAEGVRSTCELGISDNALGVAPPWLHHSCTEYLLSRVPGPFQAQKPPLESDSIAQNDTISIDRAFSFVIHNHDDVPTTKASIVKLPLRDRRDILKVMLDDEQDIGLKSVQDCMRKSFFDSDFWQLFSGRFSLQPWHSAIEFHRQLQRYFETSEDDQIRKPALLKYALSGSTRRQVERFLRGKAVDLRRDTLVLDLTMSSNIDPAYVYMIEGLENGKPFQIQTLPEDIVIVSLGSATSGSLMGCNSLPPPPISARVGTILDGSWSLWFKLAKKNSQFGNPTTFCTHLSESKAEVFTITLPPGECTELYNYLLCKVGNGGCLSIPSCNWSLFIYLPLQSTLPSKANVAHMIWGYGGAPDAYGNFIKKPMCRCAGQEVLSEILSHLGFNSDQILSTAITVPCLVPLATSALVKRNCEDRAPVLPRGMLNLAFIGNYSEIPDETASNAEYGIRSAQIAVCSLMGIKTRPPKLRCNRVAQRYGFHK